MLPGNCRANPDALPFLVRYPQTMPPVRRSPLLLVTVTLLVILAASASWRLDSAPRARAESASPQDLPGQLRYIGRDTATGQPTSVNDRFIADVERAVERYGKDEQQPVPPPAPGPVDVARLAIPRLGVDALVARLGLDSYGRLDVPQDTSTVGWNPAYNDLPGTGGATFFAAHFEYAGRPGVFNEIATLQPGDEIAVTLSDGSVLRYVVTSAIDYTIAQVDMGAVLFGREGAESITLMTCSGPPNSEGYPMRTVVLATRSR